MLEDSMVQNSRGHFKNLQDCPALVLFVCVFRVLGFALCHVIVDQLLHAHTHTHTHTDRHTDTQHTHTTGAER